MSDIGFLEEYTTDNRRYFKGKIHTLGHDLFIRLVPIPPNENANPNYPNYYVFAQDINGKEVKIGAAWLKSPNNLTSSVAEFLSIRIDDPTLPAPLNATALPKVDSLWTVVWRRRQSAA